MREIKSVFENNAVQILESHGITYIIRKEDLIKAISLLKVDLLFAQITDICGVDYPKREQRFDVVYHMLNMENRKRIRIKVSTNDAVDSITSLFIAASWWEREAFDMYGINFTGHHDMRRILTDYDFEGFPLRKDFPVSGFCEVYYDYELEKVMYKKTDVQYNGPDWSPQPQQWKNYD